MNYRRFGRMGWSVSEIGYGMWGMAGWADSNDEESLAALRRALRLGFARIIVFPYFLFTGVLVKRIYAAADRVAREHPQVEILNAPYLRDHALVLDCFVDRVRETADGEPQMNCQLCKYRAQIIGYEKDQGAPQAGHHHHVRGIGTDAGHAHAHGHHHHHHHHHPHRAGDNNPRDEDAEA